MVKARQFVFLLLMGSLMTSCQIMECGPNKDAFISKYEDLIQDVSEMEAEAPANEWSGYDISFERFVESCYDMHAEKMSAVEKRKFWVQGLKYYSLRYEENMITELMDEKNTTSTRIRTNIESVAADSGLALEAFLEKNAHDLEEIFRDFGNDLSKWVENFEEIFEDN